MNLYSASKIAVIGTGHIGTYMSVCYGPLVNGNLKDQVVLVKATEQNADALRERFSCKVAVGDTLGALRAQKPDLILVCPPPSQIPSVIEQALVPYTRERAQTGASRPDIYTFGPTPSVDFFYERLGETANVVKVLPNMFYETKGMSSAFLEVNFITFSDGHPWPQWNKDRLYAFLKPLVNTYKVSEEQSVPYLGVRNAAHCLYDMCFVISDCLRNRGLAGEQHQRAAGVMRAALRQKWTDMPKELVPCSMSDLPPKAAEFAANSAIQWILGMGDFCAEDRLPGDAIDVVRRGRVEAYLVTICLYDRQELDELTKKHATKGGLCEKSGLYFNEFCKAKMAAAFENHMDGQADPSWWEFWRKLGYNAACTLARHGLRLADQQAPSMRSDCGSDQAVCANS